uniref:Uncharacterized protein n=1 Tax=Drosophila melanogaster TaxID=7227 RepID=A0A0B4K848_DROME|nr:uncharacterized protein Dmel_CG43200 [Drosophila melanogaster]AFH07998.1 uncharacterized protein Dmel_CG43172 [Drosophila melanogaster]|eukprot:NP_001246243.1 uncharacterized protein Dmel_CG43200 [Drosophila melanogaster]
MEWILIFIIGCVVGYLISQNT